MNLKKVKDGKSKIVDSEVSLLDLIELGVSAKDVLSELDQFLPNDKVKEFVEHYKSIYDTTDSKITDDLDTALEKLNSELVHEGLSTERAAAIVEAFKKRVGENVLDSIQHPATTEHEIEEMNKEFDKYLTDLVGLAEAANTTLGDVVYTVEEDAESEELNQIVSQLQELFGADGSTLHEIAKQVGEEKVLKALNRLYPLTKLTRQKVVQELLGGTSEVDKTEEVKEILKNIPKVTDSIESLDYEDAEDAVDRAAEHAAKIEEYIDDFSKLVSDGVTSYQDIITTVQEVVSGDPTKDIFAALSEKFDKAEALEDSIYDYIKHQDIPEDEAVALIQSMLSDEDKLVIVSEILG